MGDMLGFWFYETRIIHVLEKRRDSVKCSRDHEEEGGVCVSLTRPNKTASCNIPTEATFASSNLRNAHEFSIDHEEFRDRLIKNGEQTEHRKLLY